MARRILDQADRRELVRLIVEEGLSAVAAAARFDVSPSTALRWQRRFEAAPPSQRLSGAWAETRRRHARGSAAPARTVHDVRRTRNIPAAVQVPDEALALAEQSIRDAEALMATVLPPVKRSTLPPRPVTLPEAATALRAVPARVSARVRAVQWTRRQAGGVGLTLLFIPVGWFVSAAAFNGAEAARPILSGALNGDPTPQETLQRFDPDLATAKSLGKGVSLIAKARGQTLTTYRKRGGKRMGRLKPRRIEKTRVPIVVLVKKRRKRWLRVYLPTRPNGSLAWVRKRDVKLRANPYRITISLKQKQLKLWRSGKKLVTRKIGVGQALAPTPTGRYFVTDLIKAREPEGIYGPYAFGLSGHSPVLTSFRGGNGQIGIHGTNTPETLGTEVSSGCIRIGNRTISEFARFLPLGTPVDIKRS